MGIKTSTAAMQGTKNAKEARRLFKEVLADLTAIRASSGSSVTDYTAGRAELVKLVADYGLGRAEIVHLITDLTAARTALVAARTALVNMSLVSGLIAIATTKTKIKTVTNTINFLIDGVFYAKAPTDNFWVLTGFDCTAGNFNKCLLCIDSSLAMQIAPGTEAATAGAVVLPAIPASYAVVGMVLVNPTGVGAFTGGTHDLDDGTVIPNAVFTNLAFHPSTFAAPAAITASGPAAATAVAPASVTSTIPAALTLTA